MTVPLKRVPLLNAKLRLFLFAMILANLGGMMYWPFLSTYLQSLGTPLEAIGLYFMLTRIIPLFFQIWGGWLSDRFGRLKSIALGSLSGSVGWIGIILSPSWPWLLLADGFNALTRCLVAPSFDAYIAEQSAPEKRARVFGIVQAIFQVVGVVGIPLGGWMVKAFSYRAMIVTAALLYFAATAVRLLMVRDVAAAKETEEPSRNFFLSIKDFFALVVVGSVLFWILIVDGARDIAWNLTDSLSALFLKDAGGFGEDSIGLVFGVSSVAMMIFLVPAGIISDRFGERIGLTVGVLINAFGVMLQVIGAYTAPGTRFLIVSLAAFISGTGAALMVPAFQSLVTKSVPASKLGLANGFLGTSLGLFSLPAPALGTWLWKSVHPAFPFLITSAILAVSAIPTWLFFRLPKGASDCSGTDAQTAEEGLDSA